MKRIFTLIGICCITMVLFIGRNIIFDDHLYSLVYIYKNATQNTITITYYDYVDKYNVIDIKPQEEKRLSREISKKGVADYAFYNYSRLKISNGKRVVIQENDYFTDNRAGLYDMDNYTIIEDNYSYRIYEYVFTDDFFKDGESLEK